MAMDELVRFCTEYLPNHPELKGTIDGRSDERFAALASVGRRAGFDFSEGEVRGVLIATPSVELSDGELEGLAGGRKAGERPLPYMKIVLEDVFISSY